MRRYLSQYATRARSLWIALSLAMAMSLLLVACGGTDTTTTAPTTAPTTAATTAPTTAATTGTTGTVHKVEIHENSGKYSFVPATLTIKVGETVMWINKSDAPHTVTSDTGVFNTTSNLTMDQTFIHAFAKAGTYPYHCNIHPYMKATITVMG